jgi:hypothetical protein
MDVLVIGLRLFPAAEDDAYPFIFQPTDRGWMLLLVMALAVIVSLSPYGGTGAQKSEFVEILPQPQIEDASCNSEYCLRHPARDNIPNWGRGKRSREPELSKGIPC